ncbi:MAG: zinc metallopeptidase [Ahrensia sp.]|nr:zinc metallopeptidase [Ahrensia sp.]
MALFGLIGFGLILAAIYAPQYWVKYTMQKHAVPRPDFPGSGGELAKHLIEEFKLDGVNVEQADEGIGDHYDPESRTVRLSAQNYNDASLTAVAVASHEVGHALQHARGDGGLALRQTLVKYAMVTDKMAAIFFIAAPFLFAAVRAPAAIFAMVAIGILFMAIRVVVHLVTLPVEYDASFKKALPILEQGNYLHPDDIKGARSVLKAAALTYVAASLMSLLNLARWIRVLR